MFLNLIEVKSRKIVSPNISCFNFQKGGMERNINRIFHNFNKIERYL